MMKFKDLNAMGTHVIDFSTLPMELTNRNYVFLWSSQDMQSKSKLWSVN